MKAHVYITLKRGILDPKGKAIEQSLHQLGYPDIKGVRMGKLVELVLPSMSEKEARETLEGICEKLLANTVIENYHFEFKEEDS